MGLWLCEYVKFSASTLEQIFPPTIHKPPPTTDPTHTHPDPDPPTYPTPKHHPSTRPTSTPTAPNPKPAPLHNMPGRSLVRSMLSSKHKQIRVSKVVMRADPLEEILHGPGPHAAYTTYAKSRHVVGVHKNTMGAHAHCQPKRC
jgi:hypothetical protein